MYTEEEIQAMSEHLENLENQITALKAERAKIVYKLTALKSYRETHKVAYNTRSNVWEWFGKKLSELSEEELREYHRRKQEQCRQRRVGKSQHAQM